MNFASLKYSKEFNIELNIKTNSAKWTAFHFACKNGHVKASEILMKNSVEFNINLNAKDFLGRTAFHWLCSRTSIPSRLVQMMIDNSEAIKLDLSSRDNSGVTGYFLAKNNSKVEELIKTKMPSIAF